MIAVPVRVANAAATGVFDELGSYDNRVWRFGRWDPATGAYKEVGGGLGNIQPGFGYWLITESARTGLVASGLPVGEDAIQGSFALIGGPSNAAGWNQMGNPFLFPVDVSNFLVTDGVTTRALTNGANTWTEQAVKVWNPGTGAYVNATTIDGRQAFWVKRLAVAGTVNLLFNRIPSTSGSPIPSLTADGNPDVLVLESDRGSAAAPLSLPEGAEWAFSLTVRQGSRSAEPLVLGAAAVPAGEWNSMALSVAPAPPGMELLSLCASQSGWGPYAGDYTRVFQPASTSLSWNLVLRGADAPGEVILDVQGSGVPAGTGLVLTDEVTGESRRLVAGSPLTMAAYSGDRRYRVDALAGDAVATGERAREAFHVAYPNPFRAATGLTFTLERGGDAVVEVFDVQGRLVRSIERRGLPAGEHVLVWDGTDWTGRGADSGVYLARWRTPDKQGTARLVKVN